MHVIDMHCDTLMKCWYEKTVCGKPESDLYQLPGAAVDFIRLKEGGAIAQFFAIFMLPEAAFAEGVLPVTEDLDYILDCRNTLLQSVTGHEDLIRMAYNASDLEANRSAGRMSALLAIEDGRYIRGDLQRIRKLYDLGVRAVTLTWNQANCFGAPNSVDPVIMEKGLTMFGREAVQYMQELGMLVDVSHLSDGGFRDVADVCRKPFVATHSNCRALCPHPRNLTDTMIRKLGECGGVAGLNFSAEFVHADLSTDTCSAAIIAKHARHMADVGGIDVVAIGTDFDGSVGELEVDGPDKMGILETALKKEGFSASEIDKIAGANIWRVLNDCL